MELMESIDPAKSRELSKKLMSAEMLKKMTEGSGLGAGRGSRRPKGPQPRDAEEARRADEEREVRPGGARAYARTRCARARTSAAERRSASVRRARTCAVGGAVKRGLLATLGALALASSAGCSALRSGADPELPLWVHRASGSLQVSFKRNVVAESRRTGEPYEKGQIEIDPAGGRIFVGSSDQGLYALRADDGQKLWRFETLGFVQCGPLYDAGEDVLYFGSNDGALYKVNAKNGQLLWRFMTNAEVSRRPVLDSGTLFVTNANDTLLAIEPASGKLLWHQHRTPAAGHGSRGPFGPDGVPRQGVHGLQRRHRRRLRSKDGRRTLAAGRSGG